MQGELTRVGRYRVNIRILGQGDPVVLLHGFTDDGSCWEPVATELASEGWQAVAPDARGHGRTPLPPGEPFTEQRRLADAVASVEHLVGRAVWVGHSMGALTTLLAAADRPDLVRAAVLIDPPLPGGDWSKLDEDDPESFETEARSRASKTLTELEEECRQDNPGWSDEDCTSWASSKLALDLNLFDRQQSWLGRPWREAALALKCPLLVVSGDPQHGTALHPAAVEWLRRSTTAEVVEIPGAGHSVHRDQPEEFLTLLRSFLRRLPDASSH